MYNACFRKIHDCAFSLGEDGTKYTVSFDLIDGNKMASYNVKFAACGDTYYKCMQNPRHKFGVQYDSQHCSNVWPDFNDCEDLRGM